MKKISKVATAGVLLFALANPLGAFAENNVENISATSNNKETQDITIQAKEVNGEIVFEVTAAKDTYNTVVYATINGQKFTYNLGNLKKGQISKVVQPDVSVNKKYTESIAKEDEDSGNKKNATITKESNTEKSLPNTSVVRELVEKTVLYSSELNGNVIEAKVVYKAYDLVEKNSNTIEEKKSTTENKVKDGAIVKPEVLEIPEYKENLGGAIVEPAVQPELPKAEEPAAGTTPKAEEPAAGTTPKAEEPAAGTTPKAEEPAAGTTPKAEEPAAGTTPKAENPTEKEAPKDKKFEEAKKDGKDIIEKIASSKLSEIEKVKDEKEKAELKEKLNELKDEALKAINNAKDHDAAVNAADEYQTKIDEINVPGEELPAPNYNKDNLTNGRNEGTTIGNGSTAIGHGSGEATTTPTTQPTTERSTDTTTPTQPATETTSDSTPTVKPQPVATSETATSGTSGFRSAPEVQVRTKKVVKRDLSNKTKQINIYYNLTALKDIAGALGEVGENNMLTLSGNATKEEIKKAIEEHTKSQIEKLNKQGFKVTSTTDLDQIVEGSDSYDYVVEFTKEAKTQSAGNTGFRKAPATQRRAKRSTEAQENVNVNIYFNLKTLPGIVGALDVDGDNTIKLPKNATVEQVKAAIQTKIAKVKKRGYKVNDAYFGARTEQGYDFVVEFTK